MRTQNQQPTQTVAVLTRPPCLSYPPPPPHPGNYPNPGIAWDAWRALGKLCCAPATCLYYDIDLLGSLISGRLQPHLSYTLPLSLSSPFFLLVPVGVIEIILQQLYQRGNPNDKYINKLQATTRVSPHFGSIFFWRSLDTFHLAL